VIWTIVAWRAGKDGQGLHLPAFADAIVTMLMCILFFVWATEYTDPGMFIPKNTRVMVRKINAKAQSAQLKDAPEKAAM